MPINVTHKKREFEAACKKAKKLAIKNDREYVVYWSEEYDRYRITAQENLICFDDGTPSEPILHLAEP